MNAGLQAGPAGILQELENENYEGTAPYQKQYCQFRAFAWWTAGNVCFCEHDHFFIGAFSWETDGEEPWLDIQTGSGTLV